MGERKDETGIPRRRLIQARERFGISRPELADRLKLSREYVFRVEEGWRRPRLEIMIRWADELNATMDIFRDMDAGAQTLREPHYIWPPGNAA